LQELLTSIIPRGTSFQKSDFHGNVKWFPEATNVMDAYQQSLEICKDLKLDGTIGTCTGFMDALTR
jgi:hypothetical protein